MPGNAESIPNRNVYIYNNLLLNPEDYSSAWQHFAIYGPSTATTGSNIPSPVHCDVNLQIRGNVIWNVPADLALGVEGEDQGCQSGNPTCYVDQLRRDNTINTMQPSFVDPGTGNFRPTFSSGVFSAQTFTIPAFPGGDRPQPPLAPVGVLDNLVPRDFEGAVRTNTGPPGAFISSTSPVAGSGKQPDHLQLEQNYPNPFNPSTTIQFSLTKSDLVALKVFSLRGEQVAFLVNERLAAGNHEVVWHAGGLANGIYYYVLEAGKQKKVCKAVLIK